MKSLYIVFTFCIGLLTGYLIFDHDPNLQQPVADNSETAKLKSVQINNAKILSELSLKKQNNLLSGQLILANKEISENKSALAKERQKIRTLQKQLPVNTIDSAFNDQLTIHLDTLQAITDSIICGYENKVKLTESIVAVRDSQLITFNNAYQQMQNLIDEQVARERQLTSDLNIALKQQKRTRLQNRFLAFGMLFISGFTTSLVIKAKQ